MDTEKEREGLTGDEFQDKEPRMPPPGEERVEPEPGERRETPEGQPLEGVSSSHLLAFIRGVVTQSTGISVPVSAEFEGSVAAVLDSLGGPAGLVPMSEIKPEHRWKWGLGVLGAYTGLIIFGVVKNMRAATAERKRVEQIVAQQLAQQRAAQATPPPQSPGTTDEGSPEAVPGT